MPRDEHHDNEHAARRRRLQRELPHTRVHYPGDGLDFRRPVMSASAASPDSEDVNVGSSNPQVIDLTDEDGTQDSLSGDSTATAPSTAAATAGSSRTQRGPRFSHNVIDIESSGEDDGDVGHDISNLPGAYYLALPQQRRPQFSNLRRPHRPPTPARAMDDIEFLEERPRSRRPRSASLQTPSSPQQRYPRSVTPYPTAPIDLTGDDDDVVHLDTRQRAGVNDDEPIAPGAARARGLADNAYETMGNIAGILRDGGNNLQRLIQRLPNFAGIDGDMRAQQQVFEHFQHNHGRAHGQTHGQAQGHRHHRPHGHHHYRNGRGAHVHVNGPGNVRIGMPGMMDYDTVGFDMGLVGGNRPPTPKYSPPPEAEKGFTRSPQEDEVVVCPNCGDELAMGSSDTKQEVWVIKNCGHVSAISNTSIIILLTFI